MSLALNKYSTLLRLLEYAELDGNWTAIETFVNGLLAGTGGYEAGNALKLGGVLASGYSPVAGPGAAQAFSTGALTSNGPTKAITPSNLPASLTYNAAATHIADCAGVQLAQSVEIAGVFPWWMQARYTDNTAWPVAINPLGGKVLVGTIASATAALLQVNGGISATTHNISDLGTTAVRWKDLWLQSGAFNGSDARLKTEVAAFTPAEIQAAKELAREIGTYQWLESVANKGADQARLHTGLTVQRAIEIMTANGLDWRRYAFIGYDQWEDSVIEHPAVAPVTAQAAQPAEYETQTQTETVIIDGVETELQRSVLVCIKEAVPAVEAAPAVDAWTEVTLPAGDAYSFRYDQLNMFIARGFEARLAELEAK